MKKLAKEPEKLDNHNSLNKGIFGIINYMIPKEYRLKRMKDFEILFKEGWFVNGQLLSAKVWKIDEDAYPKRKYSKEDLKIGFVVGVKVSKSAVKRNRLKRQMREIVRLMLKDKKLKPGFMVALIAKPQALDQDYKELEKDIISIFKKALIL